MTENTRENLLGYLRHVLSCSGTPDDCEDCAEAKAVAFASAHELSDEKRRELKDKFIRPEHECSEQFQEAKEMAGTVDAMYWCSTCREHLIVNNVCLGCRKDERGKYGDFEHAMTSEEWKQVQVNLPLPIRSRQTLPGSPAQRAYWAEKQRESRKRKAERI